MIFQLSLKDNDSQMVGSCDQIDPVSGVPVCGTCGYRIDPDYTSPTFRLRKKRFDISCCYDGAVIVSSHFRGLYQSLGGSSMRFEPLQTTPNFYHLKCERPIALDYVAMGTRQTRLCTGCDRYLDTFGHSGIALQSGTHIEDKDMVFSDLYFGSNNEASPLILCGQALLEAFQLSGVTGIDSCQPIGA